MRPQDTANRLSERASGRAGGAPGDGAGAAAAARSPAGLAATGLGAALPWQHECSAAVVLKIPARHVAMTPTGWEPLPPPAMASSGLSASDPGPAVLRALDAQLTRESELERRALTCRSLNPGEQAAQSG